MIGLDEEGFEIRTLRHVAGIIARREHHPVKALQPFWREVACDIITLEERQLRHTRGRIGRIAPAYRHVMPFRGQIKGTMPAERACAADYENFHDPVSP
jgi:hypothetical protein